MALNSVTTSSHHTSVKINILRKNCQKWRSRKARNSYWSAAKGKGEVPDGYPLKKETDKFLSNPKNKKSSKTV